jgi:hypothetical protein
MTWKFYFWFFIILLPLLGVCWFVFSPKKLLVARVGSKKSGIYLWIMQVMLKLGYF